MEEPISVLKMWAYCGRAIEVCPFIRSSEKYEQYSKSQLVLRSRKRINSFAGKMAINAGGCYILHPGLIPVNKVNYMEDGVHLTERGNAIFLKQLAKGINNFIESGQGCCN